MRFVLKLSKWVSITHYFSTQRVCLLLLVFISINFVSAGLTQITTSMSCTFDLKIKLIWEVFKALLICIWLLTVAMRFARFILKLEILLPILSLGYSSPNLTTSLLTFFLGHKAEFHIRSQNSWFCFSHHLSCPFCSMSQTDSHNTFLSLTFLRNSEAALSPTKMFGCCVTAKHYSSLSASPPPAWTWTGQVKKKCHTYSNMIPTYRWRDYSSKERIQKAWSIPNNGAHDPILTSLPVPPVVKKEKKIPGFLA